eukprot:12589027-Alexandrium_andersonii.AAC.1
MLQDPLRQTVLPSPLQEFRLVRAWVRETTSAALDHANLPHPKAVGAGASNAGNQLTRNNALLFAELLARSLK